MEAPKPKQERTRHDFFYFLVATKYYLSYDNLITNGLDGEVSKRMKVGLAEIDRMEKSGVAANLLKDVLNKSRYRDFTTHIFELRTIASIVIVHSAMCLEALINDYTIIRTSKSYFQNHIDKLNTASKWQLVPKLVTGNEISSDSQAYELIKNLFQLRNSLVHPKPKSVDLEAEGEVNYLYEVALLLQKHVPLSYRAIKEATHALYKLDPGFKYLDDYKWMWDGEGKISTISDLNSFYASFCSSGE